eukprot:TRINITY_DN30584_c0_g1_i1.p1 TRINITY_DN30584_c0_g1~~TRINITY_DN30584_c0_g1_i1.p1  ORF type:complete len:250 (-),score=24.19 TRINITY_DN30584_c0_g1_i1:70-819(-)
MGNKVCSSDCLSSWPGRLPATWLPRQYRELADGVPSVAGKSASDVAAALQDLNELYEGNADNESYGSSSLCNDAALAGHGVTYGELVSGHVATMLYLAQAQPGERYYDLGSGTGKTVVLAWMLGLNALGVELVKERWETSCAIRKKLLQNDAANVARLNFLHADVLDVDFSDADIVFANSLMFPRHVLSYIGRVVGRMKPGSRIITDAEGCKGDGLAISGPGLRLERKVKLRTTWASSSWFAIQSVTGQ